MDLVSFPRRFQVHLVSLDPARGSEVRKTRPCVVISPDVMNSHLATVLVAPMTSTIKGWPSRVTLTFDGKQGEIALDQIRAVDRTRLVRHLGAVEAKAADSVLVTLGKIFAK
ncbi:MAG: type II toxin-antitoxin system PemK/MazF family toxin [Rhizobiales bacterium]|nr:type II toxin-antitoxin system PemK/MazF family toxin [Hyphomicrobiales bacterium]